MSSGSIVGSLCGLAGVSAAVTGFAGVIAGEDMALAHLAVALTIASSMGYVGWRIAGASDRVRMAMPDVMAVFASKWMRKVDRTRRFPEVEMGTTNLPDGERALLYESSTMIEQPHREARTTGGTLVTVGRHRFYFGRRERITKSGPQAAIHGRLLLTDRALYFCGHTRSFSVDLDKLKSIEAYSRAAIVVSVDGDSNDVILSVSNPILWTLLIRTAALVPLTEHDVPERVSFDHGAASAATAA